MRNVSHKSNSEGAVGEKETSLTRGAIHGMLHKALSNGRSTEAPTEWAESKTAKRLTPREVICRGNCANTLTQSLLHSVQHDYYSTGTLAWNNGLLPGMSRLFRQQGEAQSLLKPPQHASNCAANHSHSNAHTEQDERLPATAQQRPKPQSN